MKVRAKLLRDKNTKEITELKSSFRLLKCIASRELLKVWERNCVNFRYFLTNWVLQSYLIIQFCFFFLHLYSIVSLFLFLLATWHDFSSSFLSYQFYSIVKLWKFSGFPVFKAETNFWCFFIFIVAPCILKIHLVSHTNKCTSIAYI